MRCRLTVIGVLAFCFSTMAANIGDRKIVTKKHFDNAVFDMNNPQVQVIDSRTIRVSGKITNPILIVQSSDAEYEFRAIGAWGTNNTWCPTARSSPLRTEKIPWPLKSIRIPAENHFRPSDELYEVNSVADIDPNGFFETTIKTKSTYFIKPDVENYHRINFDNRKLIADADYTMSMPRESYSYSESDNVDYAQNQAHVNKKCTFNFNDRFPVYLVDYDVDKVKQYAQKLLKKKHCWVTLEFKDQATRTNVTPQIIIKPIDSPTEDEFSTSLKADFEKEFNNDANLVNIALQECKKTHYAGVIWAGKTSTDTAQSLEFFALVGHKYKIETIHEKYFYFSGYITPASSASLKKTILLIEKGDKVRIEEIREGKSGNIIDSD